MKCIENKHIFSDYSYLPRCMIYKRFNFLLFIAMSRKALISKLSALVKVEKIKLERIEKVIRREKLDIKNSKLFINLSKASRQRNKINALNKQIKMLSIGITRQLKITVTSKVYLLSYKLNKTIMVDARNYLELVGKTFGDAVTMNNSTFLVAGIY